MTDELFRREMLGLGPDELLTPEAIDRFRIQYGDVVAAFQFTYALGLLTIGYLIDRIGTKRGFSLGILVWSIAGVMTTFCAVYFRTGPGPNRAGHR